MRNLEDIQIGLKCNVDLLPEDLPEVTSLTREEYNNIPVYYCSHCLSLDIKNFIDELDQYEDSITCVCDNCGSTNIEQAHIDYVLELREKNFNQQTVNTNFSRWKKKQLKNQ